MIMSHFRKLKIMKLQKETRGALESGSQDPRIPIPGSQNPRIPGSQDPNPRIPGSPDPRIPGFNPRIPGSRNPRIPGSRSQDPRIPKSQDPIPGSQDPRIPSQNFKIAESHPIFWGPSIFKKKIEMGVIFEKKFFQISKT